MNAGRIALFILLFFGFVVLYGLEVTYLGYYLERNRLLLTGLGIGLLLGLGLAWWWAGRRKSLELYDRIRLGLGIIIGLTLVFPLLLSLTNRWFSFDRHRVAVEFMEESPRYGSRFGLTDEEQVEPTHYFIFFRLNHRVYRVSSSQPLFPSASEGDTVSVMVRDGLWGFDYVAEPAGAAK